MTKTLKRNEALQRVARALFVDAAGDEPTVGPDDLTATGLPGWRLYEDAARAAIEAHTQALADACYVIVPREPTEAMELAGENIDKVVTDRIATSKDIWQAMIDIAG